MPVGQSGRIVVEFDPDLKRRLHARLRSEGRDFKAWLLERVYEYLAESRDTTEAARENVEQLSELGEVEKRVLEAVSSGTLAGHHVDDLAHATGLRLGEIQQALLQLELHGHVVQTSAGTGSAKLWEGCELLLALTSQGARSMVHACFGCHRLRVTRRWRWRARSA